MLYKNHIYIFILKFIQYHFFENQFLLKTVKVHTIFIHLKNDKIFEIVTVAKVICRNDPISIGNPESQLHRDPERPGRSIQHDTPRSSGIPSGS